MSGNRVLLLMLCLLAGCRSVSWTVDGPNSYGAHVEVGPASLGYGTYGGGKGCGLRGGRWGCDHQAEWLGFVIPLRDSYTSPSDHSFEYVLDLNDDVDNKGIFAHQNWARIAISLGFVYGMRLELNPVAGIYDFFGVGKQLRILPLRPDPKK
jgi:hypothetical protein